MNDPHWRSPTHIDWKIRENREAPFIREVERGVELVQVKPVHTDVEPTHQGVAGPNQAKYDGPQEHTGTTLACGCV